MGEILFCSQPIAALPYFIEGISWNVYSLEELCYYIENNTYLLDREFMTEELCTWIEKEIKNEKLAMHLRDILKLEGQLSEFVLAILAECGYTPKEKIRDVVRLLREMEEKTDFECNKVRADRLMEKEKYLSSIYEYRSLLESEEAKEQPPQLLGNIWHNLGTAYARLFLFREAACCYERAYEQNGNAESLREALMAYRCMKDEEGFHHAAETNGLSEDAVTRLKTELSEASRCEETQLFEEKIKKIAMMNVSGQKNEYQKAISGIIFEWKEEYRRICRI